VKAWRKMLLSVALLSSVIIYALAIEPYWIKTSIHTIGHPSVIAPTRVVQLSDLHLQTFDKLSAKVVEEVERLNPDLVVITGDAIDNHVALPMLDQFLAALPKGAHTVAILGNWEYWAAVDMQALRALYIKHNVTVLVNEAHTINVGGQAVMIEGLDDFTAGKPKSVVEHYGANKAPLHVLLQHSPGWFEQLKGEALERERPALCLAGHTHAGQVPVFGLVMWTPRGSGSYTAGFYETKLCPLYVSAGLGTSLLPVRFGARPEIAVFDFVLKRQAF
jgi:predicted MPP superfamily phosphohydrolase